MKTLAKLLILLCLLISLYRCHERNNTKDIDSTLLFSDGFESGSLVFFDLLDAYPVLKSGLKSLNASTFNLELDNALRRIHSKDINGSLRALQFTSLNAKSEVQTLSQQGAQLLQRARTTDASSYSNLSPWFEKMRNYSQPVIRGLLPISAQQLLTDYASKNTSTIQSSFESLASDLESDDTKNLLTDLEDTAHKGINQNSTVRSGLEETINGVLDGNIIKDTSIKTKLINGLGSIGEMMYQKAGFSDSKDHDQVFKELIINFEDYFTTGGSQHTSDYSTTSYSTELETLFVDLYTEVRKLIIPDTTYTKESVSLLDKLAENIGLLEFSQTTTGLDTTLKNMLRLDFKGLDRSFSNNGSSNISSLEHLFFVLSLVDSYGFAWDMSDVANCGDSNSGTACNNWITGTTSGEMTVGDTLWSLQSVIQSSSSTFNFKNILYLSSESRNIFKNNVELSTSNSTPVSMNTRVLRLLETESLGATKDITDTSTDNVYAKTVPWVMNWIKRVLFEGYGPYYNKNRTDSSGNFLALDGTQLKYTNSWSTGDYKICLGKDANSDGTVDTYRWVGLGGNESDGSTIIHPTSACSSYPSPPSNKSWTYTIQEISKTDSERAVSSDEEAFYKNFQWLLYEKRFVVVIPARAKLHSSVPFEEGLFIIAIGNGLKGMMGLKPNCGASNLQTECGTYNGVWASDTSSSKTLTLKSYSSQGTDLTTFSDVPGDSVLLIEGWGYGSSGTSSTLQTSLVLPSLVYNLLIPATTVYGLIPPSISKNFDVLERLGFLTSSTIAPSSVNDNWDSRNKLLPLVAALAKTLDDQVDESNSKNPHSILASLSKILARPYIYSGEDPVSTSSSGYMKDSAPTTTPTIFRFRLAGSSSFTGIRSPEMTSSEYYPSSSYRTPVSFLVENSRKFQDGVLSLVSKTSMLDNFIPAFAKLGTSANASGRSLIMSGLAKIVGEIKVTSDSPSSSQYNIQTYLKTKIDTLAAYPDSRSSDVSSSDWDGVTDSVNFAKDYLSLSSPYSLISSFNFLVDMLSEIPPSSQEVTYMLNVAGSLFVNTDGTRPYQIRDMLHVYTSPLLRQVAPYGRNLYALIGSLGVSGSYFSYLERNMTIGSYKITELLLDAEQLLQSAMIQRKENDTDSLLYSTGILLKAFADVQEQGKKFNVPGYSFADSLNVNDNDTYWQRLNILLSSK
ncbi:MAG: hypothetical protein AAF518_08980 [Spirochaetota bacterium]